MPTLESYADYEYAERLHLADAQELLEHPTRDAFHNQAHVRHLRGVMYLAGYAVECALKCYLIRKHAVSTFDQVLPLVRSSLGLDLQPHLHSVRHLWRAANFATIPATISSDMGICAAWQVNWRYDPAVGKARKDAREFLKATENVVRWVHRQP